MQQWCYLLALTWGKRWGSSCGSPEIVTCACHQQSHLSKQCTPHKIYTHSPSAQSGHWLEILDRLFYFWKGGKYYYNWRIKMWRRSCLESRRNLVRGDEAQPKNSIRVPRWEGVRGFNSCDWKSAVRIIAQGRFFQELSAAWALVRMGLLLPGSPAALVWWSFGILLHSSYFWYCLFFLFFSIKYDVTNYISPITACGCHSHSLWHPNKAAGNQSYNIQML